MSWWCPLLLAGCLSLGPHYTLPAAPVPASLPDDGAYASLGYGPGNNYRDIGWRDYILDARLRQTVTLALAGALSDVPAAISSQVLLNWPDVLQTEHNLKAANAASARRGPISSRPFH